MVEPNILYDLIRYWLPIVSAFALVWKAYSGAKKNVSDWAETLFSNHLSHIQTATETTVEETRQTNTLLAQHTEKEMAVWSGVVNTLAVLEDRTRRKSPRSPRKR